MTAERTDAERLATARNELAGIYQGAKGSAENKGAERGWSLATIGLAEVEYRFDDIARVLAKRDAEIARLQQERDALLAQNHGEGHKEPCTMCGEPINSLAGNPGLWPVRLGNDGWTHTGCINKAIGERDAATCEAGVLREEVRRLIAVAIIFRDDATGSQESINRLWDAIDYFNEKDSE